MQSELWAAIAEVARALAPRGGGAGDDRDRRAVVDPRRARGAGRRGAGRRRRASSASSTPRRAGRSSRGTRRRARRSRRPIESCSPSWISRRPTRSWRCTASSRAATRPPSAPASRDRRGDRGARAPGCSTSAAAPRRAAGARRRTATASSPPSPTATRRRCSPSRCWRWSSASAPALVRAKGFVHLAGEPRRGFLERAGLRTELRLGEPWGDDAARAPSWSSSARGSTPAPSAGSSGPAAPAADVSFRPTTTTGDRFRESACRYSIRSSGRSETRRDCEEAFSARGAGGLCPPA